MINGHSASLRIAPHGLPAALLAGALAIMGAAAGSTGVLAGTPPSAPASPEGADFFEKKVRPLLASRCVSCHSGARPQSGLDLKTEAGTRRGGGFGPALVPGDAQRSVLTRAVRYEGGLKMPPESKLPPEQVAILEEWVRMGAPWGYEGRAAPPRPTPTVRGGAKSEEARWAFRPVRVPAVPGVQRRAWVKNPIDAFVLARLEANGLKPNPPADRRTLLRRITFDLSGLPPTPEEVDAFVADSAPDAWEKVVDRLLASPTYGERWGRHWLDVVRYADSNGRDWNEIYPNAWRYRDWVIRSLNEDRPYNEFIRDQVAGDLVPGGSDSERYARLVATGFLVMGPKLLAQQDRVQLGLDVVDEQVDVTGKAFLGLTLGCARCHDHKFDPISAKDYYALAGIFQSTRTLGATLPRNNRVMYWHERPLAPPANLAAWKAHEQSVRTMQDAVKKCKDDAEKARLAAELTRLEKSAPPTPPMAMAVAEADPARIGDMRVHLRGSYEHLGETAPRGIPAILRGARVAPIPGDRSGRLELAAWITSPESPLTARVAVNRVWQHHFGRGLVGTPDNFGAQGERPTHPELLDWLAASFVMPSPGADRSGGSARAERAEPSASNTAAPSAYPLGWSLKKLHRLILTSSAYRMSSDAGASGAMQDPDNRWLWRMNRQRLEAEAIRDAMLAANGNLDRAAGGTLVNKASGFPIREFPVDFSAARRSVYLPVVRNGVYDFFQSFDFADPNIVMGRRNVTTVAPQALVMLNSPWVVEQSRRLAVRVLAAPVSSDEERIGLGYRLTLGREASAGEVLRARRYLDEALVGLSTSGGDAGKQRLEAWRSFCQTLFAAGEFRYVE